MLAQPERSTTDSGRETHSRVRQAGAVAPRAEASTTTECRNATRHPASLVPSITGIRLSPHGADARLLNISASGVLLESANRLRLATAVTVVFEGTFSPSSVEGRVARSSVATISKNGVLRYHIGIAFNDPAALEKAFAPANPLPKPAPQPEAAMPAPTPGPLGLVNRW